ncbi:MAG TPA: DUF4389 domain-containing protein [Acidimicrobiales bacterium]|jgi:hypothetical protein|nr:DUF4389 domain-containing protein [Acidimicrobiales bacterium]
MVNAFESAPPAPPGPPAAPDLAKPLPLLVSLPERAKQRRWTVLIRGILAIPLLIVVYFLSIAIEVITVIAWFGALFTGRTPSFSRSLSSLYLRVTLRFYAYAMFLTDQFPPFDFEDVPAYPTHIAVPEATRMNRVAVFFRLVLVLPAAVLGTAVQFGLGILSFFMWATTLITGWLPASAHTAYSAALRYQSRLGAYALLLVPTYPGGLFGDGDAPAAAVHPATVAPAMVPPAPMFPGQLDAPPITAPAPAPLWHLSVSQPARRVLVLAIVLGAIGYPALIVGETALINNVATIHTQALQDANTTLISDFNRFESQDPTCQSAANPLSCSEGLDRQLADQLNDYADTLQNTGRNLLIQSDVNDAINSARKTSTVFAQLGNAGPNAANYQRVVDSLNVQASVSQLNEAVDSLRDDLP